MKSVKSTLPHCSKAAAGRTVSERLALLDQGYHNNRLEGQIVDPGRRAAIKAMVRAGKSSDEICSSIVAHYASKANSK